MAATADVAGDKVAEARQRLATALENGKELVGRAREKAVERVRAVEQLFAALDADQRQKLAYAIRLRLITL